MLAYSGAEQPIEIQVVKWRRESSSHGEPLSTRVAILEARRTPIGKFLGAFRNTPAVDLGAGVARRVLDLAGVAPAGVDETIFPQKYTIDYVRVYRRVGR